MIKGILNEKNKIVFCIFGCNCRLSFLSSRKGSSSADEPRQIDLCRQLGLRLEEKVDNQNALQLHYVVEDPQFLRKLGVTNVERGDKVRLAQEGVDAWFVENETNGSAVSVEAKIRKIYDHYNPKL